MSILTLKAAGITLGAPLFSQLALTLHPGDRLDASEARARAMISVAPCAVTAPGGRVLFQCPQLWIAPGDRVVLLGAMARSGRRRPWSRGLPIRGLAVLTPTPRRTGW